MFNNPQHIFDFAASCISVVIEVSLSIYVFFSYGWLINSSLNLSLRDDLQPKPHVILSDLTVTQASQWSEGLSKPLKKSSLKLNPQVLCYAVYLLLRLKQIISPEWTQRKSFQTKMHPWNGLIWFSRLSNYAIEPTVSNQGQKHKSSGHSIVVLMKHRATSSSCHTILPQ